MIVLARSPPNIGTVALSEKRLLKYVVLTEYPPDITERFIVLVPCVFAGIIPFNVHCSIRFTPSTVKYPTLIASELKFVNKPLIMFTIVLELSVTIASISIVESERWRVKPFLPSDKQRYTAASYYVPMPH